MCGIFGVVQQGSFVDRDRFRKAIALLRHRGPDDEGVKEYAHKIASKNVHVALGHTRLAIFDLSSDGRQPMTDAKGRTIIYNGEIFNWPELRRELESAGCHFSTFTDTEVILAAYDKWGRACVEKFNGFWAFAILDPLGPVGQILLSRDRFGIKPLYYYQEDGVLIFSSEIAPIFEYLGKQPIIDITQLAEYVVDARSHETSQTLYKGVLELEPANNLLVNLSTLDLQESKYWSLHDSDVHPQNEDEILDHFSHLVEDAVKLRLRSDREVAITLSGGVDSSVVAVAASRARDVRSIRAFTSTFPGFGEIDETAFAARVAGKLGYEHVKVDPTILDLRSEESQLTRHQELMYVNFSMLVNWAVIHQIRNQGIAVYLTGQGGDEVFLGYERYLPSWYLQAIRDDPTCAIRQLRGVVNNTRLSLAEFLGYMAYFPLRRIRSWRYRREASQVFHSDVLDAARLGPQRIPIDIRDLQRQEILGSQLRRLLRYDDRTSSAFGLEARPALLDHRLVQFGFSLPIDMKIRNGWTKYIMRKYLERAGLPEIAWRTHKLGYPAPNELWLKTLWAEEIEHQPDSLRAPIFRKSLTSSEIPKRMQFLVYNIISTSRQLGWQFG